MSVEAVGYICYVCCMYDVITQASGKLNLFTIHSATANHTFLSQNLYRLSRCYLEGFS